MKATKFWMVWSPQGRAPTVRHPSRELAFAEAERLAGIAPQATFFVLKAVGGMRARPIAVDPIEMVPAAVEHTDADGLPF